MIIALISESLYKNIHIKYKYCLSGFKKIYKYINFEEKAFNFYIVKHLMYLI